MFGISDPGIYWAYLLVFLCVIFAVVFGIVNWNKGIETNEDELQKDLDWEDADEKIKQAEV